MDAQKPKAPGDSGFRNARGEWQPPDPIQYPPLFVWPPRPWPLAKWLLGYGGYILPWNVFFLGISIFSWYFLTPPAAQCATLRFGWMARLFACNLALLWIVYGGWHWLLYIAKLQGAERKYDSRWQAKNDPKFLFSNQVYDNVFWSCGSACLIWTAYEVFYFWSEAHGWVPLVGWRAHPFYCAGLLLAIPFWRNFHFYWIHRLIHWPPLYKSVHYLHHKNSNPGPWSGLAMHPVEHVLYFSVVLIHWIVPSHPFHFLFDVQHTALGPVNSHHGFEGPLFDGKLPAGSYFHYLHHRYINCNYGDVDIPLDRLFGTARLTLFAESPKPESKPADANSG